MFKSLRNPTFARLYIAQAISLLGDALTWLGLALLAVELAGDRAPAILATALTLRIVAFIICAPIVGIIADKFVGIASPLENRKLILVGTHLVRMVLVGLLPFVHSVWQLYTIVIFINIFHACFTPTYQATIPLVTKPQEYAPAMALASVTYQTLSIIGPGLAGAVAGWLGARTIFWLDSGSFLIAALIMLTIVGGSGAFAPAIASPLENRPLTIDTSESKAETSYFSRLTIGTRLLFADRFLRYALSLQLVGAIIGGQILVNTVSYVRGILNLGDREYGWVMMAFGAGMVVAALIVAATQKKLARHWLMFCGAILMIIVMLLAHQLSFIGLILLWFGAGIGKNAIDLPTQIAIGERIPKQQQGQVYAAHFAWSHLWWGIAYPLAGWLGIEHQEWMFPIAGSIGLSLLIIIQLSLIQGATEHEHQSIFHTHNHTHEDLHHHPHHEGIFNRSIHTHSHHHPAIKHAHFYWQNHHEHH
jgi:MFS transporter, NRE family, putaive nickel resistance protein